MRNAPSVILSQSLRPFIGRLEKDRRECVLHQVMMLMVIGDDDQHCDKLITFW